MRTGRPPKPTALKELAGNPGKRPLNRNEPKPRVTIPTAPSWLTVEGKKEYRRTAKLLLGMRVLTEADMVALASYAHEFDEWRRACNVLALEGKVITSEKGGKYLHPMWGVANTHFKNMIKLMQEFGLTPASRTRIEAQPVEEKVQSLAQKLFANVVVAE